jgi:glycerol-3-phosphate O-acyltransferase
MFYKVAVEYERPDPFRGLPRDSIVIFLMNHRSNADYEVIAYVMMGDVSISYAVGEWARAFPLETLFKSFGSYFIRRRYRVPLYHAVLESYVQLIKRQGVTQGVFPEGGLSRDGALRPEKIGLLDYALGVARDEECRRRMFVVPVAINYDRVLEDRTLLRELEVKAERPVTSRVTQLGEVARFAFYNATRIVTGRWKRYGRVTFRCRASGDSGSHGVPRVKPPPGTRSHCIGRRAPSRPLYTGQKIFPTGSRTSSGADGSCVRIPISSP